jgi:hypothetical protein
VIHHPPTWTLEQAACLGGPSKQLRFSGLVILNAKTSLAILPHQSMPGRQTPEIFSFWKTDRIEEKGDACHQLSQAAIFPLAKIMCTPPSRFPET